MGFEPNDGEDYDSQNIVNEFKYAIEKNYWPAIESNELEIQLKLNNENIPINIILTKVLIPILFI